VVALIVQVLVNEPLAAFLSMAVVSLLGVPFASRFPLPALGSRDELAAPPEVPA